MCLMSVVATRENILAKFSLSKHTAKEKRLMELIVFDGCAKKQARKTKSKNDRHQAHEIDNFQFL